MRQMPRPHVAACRLAVAAALLALPARRGLAGAGGVGAADGGQSLDPSGEHPLRRLGPKSQCCSACKLAAANFQAKVGRRIRRKWPAEKRRAAFEENLPAVCQDGDGFPAAMAAVDRDDGLGTVYVDIADMNRGARMLSIKQMGDEVKPPVLAACRHLVEVEFRDALLNVFAKQDGRDVDFVDVLCGRRMADVCDTDVDDDMAEEL